MDEAANHEITERLETLEFHVKALMEMHGMVAATLTQQPDGSFAGDITMPPHPNVHLFGMGQN